ncbi:Clavaminate synthase-like protein [Colletotrichum karsti]|uniref:Clavaminate synthase-like protein n=1 Tax=Colletotrichum karsti TaxID=1095194 RepID=A0A9P6HUR3_9PEZI|nr:Clavaminate synthase-like protein [Colletotrichum karsti]KAF9870425.1 Clavaminate synthase-like protein [Colletotrichum karsti]
MSSTTTTQSLPAEVSPAATFPEGLPTVELPRISLRGLLENDETEMLKIFDICLTTGFFYLNLQDHPDGQRLWEKACRICEVGKQTLPKLDMDTKLSYKARERTGVFDMGYKCPSISKTGEPKFSEAFNELFGSILTHGNEICRVLLGALEKHLQLDSGKLSSLHRVQDPSNDFLRVLRYPATLPGDDPNAAKFPPHRDSVSVAILFTWVGGLQILEPGSSSNPVTGGYDESAWRWVEPVDGHVIVNLGDALAVLTNEVLKSGFHRVIGAPGNQARLDKYSVLLGYRPALNTPMRPLPSPVIPPLSDELAAAPIQTCEEWGAQRVQKVYQVLEQRKT